MQRATFGLLIVLTAGLLHAGEPTTEETRANGLRELGFLDVTQPPYSADPTGQQDSTEAIQRAVNDARDGRLVCFFPEGTYLISDTISCEQQVRKLDQPRAVDSRTQHYWDESHRILLFGSGKGKRPVIKLSPDAKGFNDPDKPKYAVWIWAQTRDDAPGKQEPEWGKEQPNIAFSHFFKGIDIDIRGQAGAIGLRFSGAQGSSLLDCTVYADGAFAGFSDCPGQGGGTYNIETIGGRYGIAIDSVSRFPILVGCKFTGQTGACIGYRGSIQVPSLLVGCQLEPKGNMAVDFPGRAQYAGINIVDCRISIAGGGVVAGTGKPENIHIEDTYVRGAKSIVSGGEPLPSADGWNLIEQYSSTTAQGVNLINGVESSDEITRWKAISDAPAFEALRERHYRRVPCFDEAGVVNVKDYGAKGDGETDDTEAFKKAIAAGDNVFVPKGNFKLTGTLALRPNTHLFGLSRTFSSIGGESQFGGNSGFRGNSGFGRGRGADQPGAGGGRQGAKGRSGAKGGERRGEGSGAGDEGEAFTIVTVDDPEAAPGFSHLGARGNLQWRSGKGTSMLATGLPTSISGSGGGRFYGAMNMRRQLVIEGLTNPVSLYAFNVERVTANPQSIIRNCKHLRIYYFKVEAGTVSGPNAGDANTPGQISNSSDVRVYCMYGNVRKLEDRPMLEIVNSTDVAVSQLKAFQPGSFPHLIEVHGDQRYSIPSSKTVALFVRDAQAGQTAAR